MLRSMKALHEPPAELGFQDALLAIDSFAGLVMQLTVQFSFCDFF